MPENYAETIVGVAKDAVGITEKAEESFIAKGLIPVRGFYKHVDLRPFDKNPAVMQETITLNDPADFAAYVNRYKSPATVVLADQDRMTFRAIVDFHEKDQPRWCRHQALYACPQTPEFKEWWQINDEWLPQSKFAEFLEEHVPEIVKPDGADLIEAVASLQAHREVSYKSAVDLASQDIQFVYEEETTTSNKTSKGEFRLPKRFSLRIRVFRGGQFHDVEALLRYNIDHNKRLNFKFKLHRFQEVRDLAFSQIENEIDELINPEAKQEQESKARKASAFEVPVYKAADTMTNAGVVPVLPLPASHRTDLVGD